MSANSAAAAIAGAGDAAARGQVRTDLTRTHFRGFVRRDESWPEDSPQYRAGCEIENRKRPPPDEVPGDALDRQRVICGFDQGLIERQVCLVLGAGGIGQDVALTLARLGVGKIILVDRDVYDVTNLTRQCLGCKSDVGQRKVEVAARTLQEKHSLCSEIEAVHCDAVLEWPRIVELARSATAVFNGIDVGVMWDYCVNALCKELGIPLTCGQSFGWKWLAEMYTGRVHEVCAFCYDSTLSTFAAEESMVRRKSGVRERLVEFLAGSGLGGDGDVDRGALTAFLAHDRQFRLTGGALLGGVIEGALARCGRAGLARESLAEDLLAFLKALHAEVTERLLPGRISQLPDIAFIPRPIHADTRFIGSWVCPCLGCAVMMVSQWAAWLTAPPTEDEEVVKSTHASQLRNLTQTVTFNLDVGMTSEEQLGYELGALGMPPDKAERRFVCEAPNQVCVVCRAAAGLADEESLFVGRIPIVLSPVPGTVSARPANWRDPPPPGHASGRRAALSQLALSRRQPLAHLGDDYANVVVPAMPALDWERAGEGEPSDCCPDALATLPLLKVHGRSSAASHPSALYGVASGIRSALVKAKGKWWRLKGCGNREEGFPVEARGDHGELNIRGCCFGHNVDTELRMTELAAAALHAAGLDCANRPVGSYAYAPEASWPLQQIERHCCIFETLGNARLGDHLLTGLLKLLPCLWPDPGDGFATLRAAVAAGRGADPGDIWPTEMTISCGMPTSDVAAQLASAGARLQESAPPSASEMAGQVPAASLGTFDNARARLARFLPRLGEVTREPSLLLWLAWRLGWECGATLRALHCADIAWGTYPDAMGIHCNAHANNLVVKPLGSGSHPDTILAALDFDMAFTRAGFLPEAVDSHASLGLNTWEGVQAFEASAGMRMVLAGSDFASTGVANTAVVPESHQLAEVAVRDTLVSAYEAARAGGADAHPHQGDLQEAAYDLIRLALCLTTEVEG